MNDGIYYETHLVRDFTFDSFDLEADTVSGTADPGSELAVGVWVDNNPIWAIRIRSQMDQVIGQQISTD